MRLNYERILPSASVFLSLSLLVMMAVLSVQAWAPQEQPSKRPLVAAGKLVSVDPDAKTFSIVGREGAEVAFHFDEATKVTGAPNVQGLANNDESWVKVQYWPKNGTSYAVAIETAEPKS